MSRDRFLRLARLAAGMATIAAATLAAVHAAGRGVDLPFFRSHSLNKALVGTGCAYALYVAAGGWYPKVAHILWLWRHAVAGPLSAVSRVDTRWWALACAAAVLAFGLTFTTAAGASSDSYGYISQADLFRAGRLVIDQPFVEDLPFQNRRWMVTTLAYRPSSREDAPWSLVPLYSPGLSGLMALAKSIGGQEAMFWIVPLSSALLVMSTYGIGRRLASPEAGLAGAWLMASSPVVLFMTVAPMSDVPVSAFWALALYLMLRSGPRNACLAGLAAGLAITIRPNTVIGAPILASWYLVVLIRARRGREDNAGRTAASWRMAVWEGILFCLGMLPGVLAVAVINQLQSGSPLISSYGSVSWMFDRAHVMPNLRLYGQWLMQAHTPFVWLGVLPILVPLRRFWPRASSQWLIWLLAAFGASIWLMYCYYLEFDGWWYLRFMLPAFPLLLLGVGVVAVWIGRWHRGLAVLSCVGLMMLGAFNLRFVLAEHVTNLWRIERRFPSVASLTRGLTAPRSVIFANQHSGTLRYYAGRLTFRFDSLGDDKIDDVIAWLLARRIHPYLLIDDSERSQFETLHAGQKAVGRLSEFPLLIYRGPATIRLFDLVDRRTVEAPVAFDETYAGLRSMGPQPLPRFTTQRWPEVSP